MGQQGHFSELFNVGPALSVDPLDRGEMALANKFYKNDREMRRVNIRLEETSERVDDVLDLIRDTAKALKFDEQHVKQIDGVLRSVCESARESNSLLKVGSTILKSAAPLLLMIPGVNIMWGVGCYSTGAILGIIDTVVTHEKEEVLSQNRFNTFENMVSNISVDGYDRIIRRCEEAEERVEKFEEWIKDISDRLSVQERKSREFKGLHLLQFWRVEDDTKMIITVCLHHDVSSLYYVYADLNGKWSDYNFRNIPDTFSGSDTMNIVATYGRSYSRERPVLVSTSTIFCTDSVLANRIRGLGGILGSLHGSIEELRTALLMYLQLGVHSPWDN